MATETEPASAIEQPTFTDKLPDDLWIHVALLFSIVLMGLPLLLAFIMSTQTLSEVYETTNLAVGSQAAQNYGQVLTDFNFGRYLINSMVMSLVIVVGKVGLSLLAALALVYYDFPYERAVFMFILLTLLLPVPVRLVPLFQMMADLGWSNTLLAITGPYIASATAVFLLRQHFMSISGSLVESARLDGVGPITFLFKVLIPMSKGMIAGVSVITFVYAWNQYLWPLIILSDNKKQVVQVGIRFLQNAQQSGLTEWGLIMAGSIIALMPPLLVLIVMHRPLLNTFAIQTK